MAYNPSTDFVGLWRAVAGGVEKGEIPGLDFWVAAMARAGIINLVVSGVAPVANQDTTAWFQTATPSYAAEGALYLWDETTSQYVPATPDLFFRYLQNSSSGGSGVNLIAVTGVPSGADGSDGDFALRLDAPGGIYGPKAGGAWPADPLPGTSYSQISDFLDVISDTEGDILIRGASEWEVLDADEGSILFRGVAGWEVLAPGVLGQSLQTGGPAANPAWASAVLIPPNRFTDITPGAHVFTATVTGWHRLTMNGAGGGGGGAENVSYAAGGGGGGQVVDYVFLTNGVNYNYFVGSDGIGGTTSGTGGVTGGNTTFDGPGGTIIAEGGGGGQGATGGGTGTMGGPPGFGSGFSANGYALSGGVGYSGVPQTLSGGAGGNGAGFGAQGGPGGGNVGGPPGGAGGGAAGGAGAQAGGDGADGQIIIEF